MELLTQEGLGSRTGIRLRCVGIPVNDLVAAVSFYCGKLGFKLLGHEETPTKMQAFVGFDGGAAIELFQPRPATVQSLKLRPDHLAFECTDIEAYHEALANSGMYVPSVLELGNGVKNFQLIDPDGTLLEFFEGRAVNA
jgi:catechol 2,3-dioxygenase-like lactoylglutathione lyase family enzyme